MEPERSHDRVSFFMQRGDQAERRRCGRLRCDELRCSMGEIRDLSASGMQVFRRGGRIGKVGLELQVVIDYLDSAMAVDVQIVRAEKLGFRKHLYGLAFINLSDEQRARLTALARVARDKLSVMQR